MARVTPQDYADKLIRRGQAAAQDYTKGINAVTVSPTGEAAKKLDKAAMNFAEAVSSGRMARRLNEVTLESWKKSAAEKGSSRYGPGLAAAGTGQRPYGAVPEAAPPGRQAHGAHRRHDLVGPQARRRVHRDHGQAQHGHAVCPQLVRGVAPEAPPGADGSRLGLDLGGIRLDMWIWLFHGQRSRMRGSITEYRMSVARMPAV
jgi:hypothetical protein